VLTDPEAACGFQLRLAAFQNPELYKAQAMRLSTYDKPRVIACAEDHAHHIGLPRGRLDDVCRGLTDLGVSTDIRDERHTGVGLDMSFQGQLRPEQNSAAEAMLRHDTGVLAATTAFGKTVVAAWLVARRGVSTLVLVHRVDYSISGSSDCQPFWVCRRSRSVESAVVRDDRAARRRRHSASRQEGSIASGLPSQRQSSHCNGLAALGLRRAGASQPKPAER